MRGRSGNWRVCLGLACFLGAGCRWTSLALWGPTPPEPAEFTVETQREIAYHSGPDAESRHRLDLYIPTGKRDAPVLVLVHGGAWIVGDSRCLGLYSSVAEFFARQGYCVVVPNYRLSPHVKHPEHVRDLARAVAWTKAEIGLRGGDPQRIFLLGHSAGGHLVTLLATDPTYLQAEGLATRDLKGVVAVSGVYRIPPGDFDVSLGGTTPRSFRWSSVLPLRGDSTPSSAPRASVPLRINVFGPAFGDDAAVRDQASPITHVRPALPPMLILHAEHDLPALPDMARDFHRELLRHENDARLVVMERRNHNSILFNAIQRSDPTATTVLEFMSSRE